MKAAYCRNKNGEPEVLYIHPAGTQTSYIGSKMRKLETVLVGKLLMPIPVASACFTGLYRVRQ